MLVNNSKIIVIKLGSSTVVDGKGKFKTKKDAVSYYDKHNPHMRSLNALKTYISDWDPNTKLLYIVRDDYLINATIDCFSIDDNNKWLK